MASSAERELWRLVRPHHAPGLDGEGARLAGGRWNSAGRPLVYAASHLSLAVLESFVHLPAAARLPEALPDMRAVRLLLPASLIESAPEHVDPGDLRACRAVGDAWAEAGRALGLAVPSAIVPRERNVLIDPRHPDMARLKVAEIFPFAYDARLAGAR